jgi:site-specific recombinase XerC
LACHARFTRNWRKKHRPTQAARRKSNCRSYANTYQRRGKLQRQPCVDCGNPNSQKHHPDYTKPLLVIWVCVRCHKKRDKANEHAN